MPGKPIVGGSRNSWGTVLNDYLTVAIDDDGELRPEKVEASYAIAGGPTGPEWSSNEERVNRISTRWFDITDPAYGGIEGGTDISTAYAAALVDAQAAPRGGIQLPFGIFGVNASLRAKTRVAIKGAGKYRTILTGGAALSTALILGTSGDTVTEATISDLSIDGQYSVSARNINAIQITSGARCTVENVAIFDVARAAVLFTDTPDSVVRNCYIDRAGQIDGSTGHSIHFEGASHRGKAQGNTIVAAKGGMGIAGANGPLYLNISGNTIGMAASTTGFEAIGLDDTCLYATITGNTIYDSQDNGISCSAAYSTVTGNTINGCLNHGIYTQGPYTTITGNTVINCGKHYLTDGLPYAGVTASTTEYCTIVGNTIVDNQATKTMAHAVKLTSSLGHNVVGPNVCDGYHTSYIEGAVESDVVKGSGNSVARESQTLSVGGAVVFDALLAESHRIILSANASSSTIINATIGGRITMSWRQDGTGGRTYVWPTNCKFAGGAAGTPSTTAFYRDTYTFEFDGTNWYELERAVAVR